jgi:hypothetical protein
VGISPGFHEILAKAALGTPTHAQLAQAVMQSRIRDLGGLPYPLQFRNQNALSAWSAAMRSSGSWPHWNDPGTSCRDLVSEMQWQFDRIAATLIDPFLAENWYQGTRHAPLECSTNLLYALRKGTLIEGTAALETLLLNSDIDRNLPLSMLALPYRAQYIRFGHAVGRAARLPDGPNPDNELDGVFCFLTPPTPGLDGYPAWRLEFIFIATVAGRYFAHVMLLGTIENRDMPVMEWLSGILSRHKNAITAPNGAAVRCALDYVAKLLLYLGLRQARIAHRNEHSEALKRLDRLGCKKRGRHLHRLERQYDRIEVGPERIQLPDAGGSGAMVAPHWRRGHFRLQAYGQGRQERKMIYIPPILVHARDLTVAPQPKSYRVDTSTTGSA